MVHGERQIRVGVVALGGEEGQEGQEGKDRKEDRGGEGDEVPDWCCSRGWVLKGHRDGYLKRDGGALVQVRKEVWRRRHCDAFEVGDD